MTIATALDSPNHKQSIGTKNCLSDASFNAKTIPPTSFYVWIFLPALNWTSFPLLSQISKSPLLSNSNWSNLQKMTRDACHSINYGQNWPKRRINLKTDLESPEVGASAQPFTISVMFLLWSQYQSEYFICGRSLNSLSIVRKKAHSWLVMTLVTWNFYPYHW